MTGLVREPDRPCRNDWRAVIGRTDRHKPVDCAGGRIHTKEPSERVSTLVIERVDEPGLAVDDRHGPPVTWGHGRDRGHRVRRWIDPGSGARADVASKTAQPNVV